VGDLQSVIIAMVTEVSKIEIVACDECEHSFDVFLTEDFLVESLQFYSFLEVL